MSQPDKMENITLIRGVAASLVLVIHSFLFLGYSQPYSSNIYLTSIGVDIFFILSGFIMTLAHWDDFDRGASTVVTFLKKRIVRIYPMYFIVTAVTSAVLFAAPQLFHSMEYSNILLFKSLLFMPLLVETSPIFVIAVAWTLSYEILFYLIFAACLLLKRRNGLITIVCALSIWALTGVLTKPINPVADMILSTLPIEFIAGVLLCAYYKSALPPLPKKTTNLTAILIIAVAISLFGAAQYQIQGTPLGDNKRALYYITPALLIFALLFTIKLPSNLWINRTINLVGDASYSIYLTHLLTIGAIKFIAARSGAIDNIHIYILVVTSCIICTAAGIAAHKVIEIPATKIMRSALLNKRQKS
ncbi:acyltransferase family protein [Pseudomonas protegens]|uniref:acyltransferase family protein n=1 Tax=Pseudomonas protegens TaxID=380021 RepID=UPI002747B57B|nr:acyltransferase [Pseudomonas protegens]MDP9526173.1 acyltransferase [Pseudomonas protegens]